MKKNTPQLLKDFIEGLQEMIGASSVMIHHHQDLRWHGMRESLEEVKMIAERFAINPLTAGKVTRYEKKSQILMPNSQIMMP